MDIFPLSQKNCLYFVCFISHTSAHNRNHYCSVSRFYDETEMQTTSQLNTQKSHDATVYEVQVTCACNHLCVGVCKDDHKTSNENYQVDDVDTLTMVTVAMS